MVIALVMALLLLLTYAGLLAAGWWGSRVLLKRFGIRSWWTRIVLALTAGSVFGMGGCFLPITLTEPPRQNVNFASWYLVAFLVGALGTLVWTTRKVHRPRGRSQMTARREAIAERA